MTLDPSKAADDIDNVLAIKLDYGGTAAVHMLAAHYRACVDRWAPSGSSYRKMADGLDPFDDPSDGAYLKLKAILTALLRDYRVGMVTTFEELVHAAMFDDMLGQATYLLAGGYSLPAAVIAGAVLEEHLRTLATRHGITLVTPNNKPKAASTLNDNLHTAKAILQPEWRRNQVSIDIRNEAAHGKPEFQARAARDITQMIDDTRNFIIKHPA